MIYHGEFPQGRLGEAIDRGFDPGERPEPAPAWVELDDEWTAALEAARRSPYQCRECETALHGEGPLCMECARLLADHRDAQAKEWHR